MSTSHETVHLQDEWSTTLERTMHELTKTANQAAKSYEAYVSAMSRVGQLYATCGELMASANTPGLAAVYPIPEAAEARALTGRLTFSMEHWWRSSDEQSFIAFLTTHHETWQRWRQEVTRTNQHNKTRREVLQLLGEVNEKLEAARAKDASARVRELEREVYGLKGELQQLHERVQRDIANNAKLCSRDLMKYGGQLGDLMSSSGYNTTCCFQPMGTAKAAQASTSVFPAEEPQAAARPPSNDFSITPSDDATD